MRSQSVISSTSTAVKTGNSVVRDRSPVRRADISRRTSTAASADQQVPGSGRVQNSDGSTRRTAGGKMDVWKHDSYTESLKRSLAESQMERDFLTGMTEMSRYDTMTEDQFHNGKTPFSLASTMSERMLTQTTAISMATTATSDILEDYTTDDFPEFRIETAVDKLKVNLTDDFVVSLSIRDSDNMPGINASWKDIHEMRCDIFESRIAENCVWFDLSGNALKFDAYAKEENVLGTVKSRKMTPGQVPDMWSSFTNLLELTFGKSCSEESTCKRGNLLRHIPPSIFDVTSLRILSFSSSNLQDIPKEVENLVNLEELYVDDNELLDFQQSLLNLPRLRILDMDHNSLENITLTSLPRWLRCLRLKGNNISHIELQPCKTVLQQLDLSCNNIQNLESVSFKSLTKLKFLDLSSNVIEFVPKSIGKLENLRKLYLDDNMLDELTSSICLIPRLRVLNISQNNIGKLPPEMGNLKLLRELYAENNQLDSLPQELENISRLLTLCISGNKLVRIPPVIGKMPFLRDLLLFNNKIRVLDMSILSQCQSLVVLGLATNRIKKIPPEISELKTVRIIQLDSNRIIEIPEKISQLTTLRYLSLNNNRIEYIPDSMALLSELVGLLLDNNSLTEVPASVGQLKKLRVLSVKHNYIEFIPDSFSLLVNIELVDVCDNKLTRLPSTISQWSEKVDLKTQNNNLSLPPQEVADRGIISIKTFLAENNTNTPVETMSASSEFETTAI